MGTKLLPKLRSGEERKLGIDLSVTVDGSRAEYLLQELQQILADLGIAENVMIHTH